MAVDQEARDVLSHLFSKVQQPHSKFYSRYGTWIQRHQGLEDLIFKCLRPEVLTWLRVGNGNVNSLKNIGGDLNFEGRAIYLHGILGLDRHTRIYVGQSNILNTRLKQHWNFRYRRDNPSLHYYAMQQSIFDAFIILAYLPLPKSTSGLVNLPGMDQPDLFLNMLEMWCCLLFRSLPEQMLKEFLPPGSRLHREGVSVALNIASPLEHGENGARQWVDLSRSADPLVQDFFKQGERKRSPVEYVEEQKLEISPIPAFLILGVIFVGWMLLKVAVVLSRSRVESE